MHNHRLVVDKVSGRVYAYVDGKLASDRLFISQPHDVRSFINATVCPQEGSQRLEELRQRGEIEYTSPHWTIRLLKPHCSECELLKGAVVSAAMEHFGVQEARQALYAHRQEKHAHGPDCKEGDRLRFEYWLLIARINTAYSTNAYNDTAGTQLLEELTRQTKQIEEHRTVCSCPETE